MSELPNGWALAALSELCKQPDQRSPHADETFTYIDIASVDRDLKIVSEPQRLIGSNASSRARKLVERGDVIISMTRPNLNAVALIGEQYDGCIASTGFDVLRPIEVEPRWIFSAVRSAHFVDAMCKKVQGALYPAIKSADIREYQIPLPPLAEQTRITAKLDELLAQVDTLKARIDGIPVLLKSFRQSVLAAAVSGQLTRQSYDSLSGTYALEPLSKLVAEPLRNGKSVKDGIGQRVLRLSALKKNNIDFFESKAGNWTGINFDQYIVKNDDFLISRGNGSKALVGRGGLARHVTDNVAYPDTMIRVRPDKQKLLPKFLATVWNSQLVRGQIESTARTTAGIWKISQGDLEVLKIPLPSLVEQSEIVHSVEQLFAYADQLETKIASAKSRIDHLTQSILTKAFRGELVPQDPNDELASVLLDRIKAQRAATPKAKRGRQAATSR